MASPVPLSEAAGAAVETAFAIAGLDAVGPLGSLLASSAVSYLVGRRNAGHKILLDEFKKQNVTTEDIPVSEELAAGLIRYGRAIRNQAADENLRLLAQAMVNLARREKLWSRDYLKYADILSDLSRDEIILIGAFMAEDKKYFATPRPPKNESAVWKPVVDSLVGSHGNALFPNTAYVEAVAARAQRTGLILAVAMGLMGPVSTAYALTPIGREVRELIDIESVIDPRYRAAT